MSFLTGSLNLDVYTDTAQTEFPNENLVKIFKEFSSSVITEAQITSISLAASGSQAISFNGVGTVKRFYLYSDAAALTLTINGSATTFTYEAGMPGYIPIQLSSLTIVNASSSVATTVTLAMIAE